MKYLFLSLLTIVSFWLAGQNMPNPEVKVKTGQVFINKKLSFYYENDKNGNMIFSKNDGANGPITMLSVSEFDSLNREIRVFFAHSNIGFSLSETVYEANQIKEYSYSSDSETMKSFDRELLSKINSSSQFLELDAVKDLLKGDKHLTKISILDSAKKVSEEYYISKEGDTTSINFHRYDSKNNEVFFHYGTINSERWTWDIYKIYDHNANLIKSYRVSSEKGINDTTEVYNYIYDSENRIISRNYYYKREFRNKTNFIYNPQGRVAEERFYEGDEAEIDVEVFYYYDKKGNLVKKIANDFRKPEKERKEIKTFKLTYW